MKINVKLNQELELCLTKLQAIGLKTLSIINNQEIKAGHQEGIKWLKRVILENDVKCLNIIGCKLDYICLQILKPALSSLISLDLSSNGLSVGSIKLISSGITNNNSILTLNLNNNRICGTYVSNAIICGVVDISGLKDLCSSLLTCSQIASVDLSCNYLGGFKLYNDDSQASKYNYGSEVAVYLRELLTSSISIKELNLTSNDFDFNEPAFQSLFKLVGNGSNETCKSLTGRFGKCKTLIANVNYSITSASNKNICIPQCAINSTELLRNYFNINGNSSGNSSSRSSSGSSDADIKTSENTGKGWGTVKTIHFQLWNYSSCNLDPTSAALIGDEVASVVANETSSLISLDLSNNFQIRDAGLEVFCSTLLRRKRKRDLEVHSLMLSQLSLNTTSPLVPLIMDERLATLMHLDISCNNSVGDHGMAPLLHALSRTANISLQTLNLSQTGITADSVELIRRLLVSSNSLQHVDLSDNDFGDVGSTRLLCELQISPSYRSLALRRVGMKSMGLTMLSELLQRPSCGLVSLDLTSNDGVCGVRPTTFDPAPVLFLADALKTVNRKLEYLNLSWNDIGARSGLRLSEALALNETLHSLDLRSCHLSEQGAMHLGGALPNLRGLRWLDVSHCGFGPDSTEIFFNGLSRNTSLLGLDTSNNDLVGFTQVVNGHNVIDWEHNALAAICACLRTNTTLQYLNLSYNSLLSVPLPPSDLVYAPLATVKMLLDALEANRGLRSVDLTGNLMAIEMFSPHNAMRDPDTQRDLIDQVARILNRHPTLRSFVGSLYPPQRNLVSVTTDTIKSSQTRRGVTTSSSRVDSISRFLARRDATASGSSDFFEPKLFVETFRRELTQSFVQQWAVPQQPDNVCVTIPHICAPNDLLVLAVFNEIRFNHYAKEVRIKDESHGLIIAMALKDNICLNRFVYPTDWSLEAVSTLERNKIKSFNLRVGLAVYIRGTRMRLDSFTLRSIVEYVVSPGPLVDSLLTKYAN